MLFEEINVIFEWVLIRWKHCEAFPVKQRERERELAAQTRMETYEIWEGEVVFSRSDTPSTDGYGCQMSGGPEVYPYKLPCIQKDGIQLDLFWSIPELWWEFAFWSWRPQRPAVDQLTSWGST